MVKSKKRIERAETIEEHFIINHSNLLKSFQGIFVYFIVFHGISGYFRAFHFMTLNGIFGHCARHCAVFR